MVCDPDEIQRARGLADQHAVFVIPVKNASKFRDLPVNFIGSGRILTVNKHEFPVL